LEENRLEDQTAASARILLEGREMEQRRLGPYRA